MILQLVADAYELIVNFRHNLFQLVQDVDLTADDLKELADQFKAEYKEKIGADFPTDPKEQLMEAINRPSGASHL